VVSMVDTMYFFDCTHVSLFLRALGVSKYLMRNDSPANVVGWIYATSMY
jgi:hypothetical protein